MSEQTPAGQVFNVVREEQISVPAPATERRMGVRCLDWERIKNRISEVDIKEPVSILQQAYFFLFAVAVTAGLSIMIVLPLGPWITSVYSCVSVFSLVCGIIFVFLDRKFYSEKKSELKKIVMEMEIIEKTFSTQDRAQ
jgi:hypothetical protein